MKCFLCSHYTIKTDKKDRKEKVSYNQSKGKDNLIASKKMKEDCFNFIPKFNLVILI